MCAIHLELEPYGLDTTLEEDEKVITNALQPSVVGRKVCSAGWLLGEYIKYCEPTMPS